MATPTYKEVLAASERMDWSAWWASVKRGKVAQLPGSTKLEQRRRKNALANYLRARGKQEEAVFSLIDGNYFVARRR